jgi:hypothetical protein
MIYIIYNSSTLVPFLEGHIFCNEKVASPEEDNLLIIYYLSASEIWPDKRGSLWWEWPIKRGTTGFTFGTYLSFLAS